MTSNPQTPLEAIIERLEAIQQAAPTKTTFTMGRADHSMSNQLLDIIHDLKALADDKPVTEPEPAKSGK